MATYRCYSCDNDKGLPGCDFDVQFGTPVVCPHCGEKFISDTAGQVSRVEVIHYDPPVTARKGKGFAACNPALKMGTGKFSGEPAAVTCPNCRKTPIWREQAELRGVPTIPEELDVAVILDPTTGLKPAKSEPASGA